MKTVIVISLLALLSCGCNETSVSPGPNLLAHSAKDRLAEVNSLAESLGKGLRLLVVSSQDIRIDGTSDSWQYRYVDTSNLSYWFHASSSAVALDSTSSTGVGAAFITHPWFNSDSALFVAELNGGAQFRQQNSNYLIVGSIGEPVIPNATTTWWIGYRSKDDKSKSLYLAIDAMTGTVTSKYP